MADLTGEHIRRIRCEQLELGMYIAELSDQRALESGLEAEGLVTRQQTLRLLQKMDVSHVYIDVSKGRDCPQSESVQALQASQEETLRQLASTGSRAAQLPFDEAVGQALEVRNRAHALAHSIMQDVKMGRGFDTRAVDEIATQVVSSLSSNQNALASLMRVRRMDNYLLEHSTNVAVLMGLLARSLGIAGDPLQRLVFGAFVHDIGKVRVPEAILHKPGRLTPVEWAEMKRHVDYGMEALEGLPDLAPEALEICAQHHERLDGTGYPFALPAEDISRHGRMAAVVDVYDAITADRVYHRGSEPTTAMRKMLEWSGTHLDRDLVYQLIRCIGVYPAGSWVQLSGGLVAMVREVNLAQPNRPRVLLAYDPARGRQVPEEVVDLAHTDAFGEIRAAVCPADYGLQTADYLRG